MKKSILIHTIWGACAISTFAAGYLLAKPGGDSAGINPSGSLTAARLQAMSGPLNAADTGSRAVAARAGEGEPVARPALTEDQLKELAKEVFNDPNPLKRNIAFSKMLESLTPENATAMLETMKSNRAGGDQFQLFLYAWGAVDGAGAMAHADTLEGRMKQRFLNETLPGWAGKNADAAIAWLETQKEDEGKNRLRSSLMAGLADGDLGFATGYALQRADAGDKQAASYLETVAGEQLRKNGAVAAAAWGEALPDGELKGAALDRVAGQYSREDPAAAAAWAAKYATTDYGARVVEEVGDTWAARDPKAAVEWLNTLAEGQGRSEGTFSALRNWTRKDPLAASQYLVDMPASQAKDSAVSGFARSLAGEDPQSAIAWAGTISDDASRVKTLTRAGQSWFRSDPVAASNWLQTSNLPQAAREAIVNPQRDGRRRNRG